MQPTPVSAPPPWWFLLLAPLLAFATVFAAFAPALDGRFLGWDDMPGVAQNADLRLTGMPGLAWRFSTRHMGHYQPLSWWSLSLDVADAPAGELGPTEAARCHRTNLMLHALAAVAFALLAERLLRAVFRGSPAPPSGNWIATAALFAALSWALHPLRVESVAWITERRDVLSIVPLLLSVYMYVLWATPRAGGRVGPTGFLVASFVLLAISLLCKAWGIVVPALLLVLDYYPLRRAGSGWRTFGARVLEKAPFIVLATGFAGVAAWAQASQPDAMPGLGEHTLVERCLQAAYGLCFYTWKSLVPAGLSPLYELPKQLSIFDARFAWPVVAVVVAALLFYALRRRLPALTAAALAAVILVAPVLGFAQAGPQLVADRYSYLFGLVAALAVAGALLVWSQRLRFVPWILGATLLVLFGSATRAQTAIWHDTQSLWSYVVAREPGHVVGNLSLGNEYARRAILTSDSLETVRLLREAESRFAVGLEASNDARFASKLGLIHRALAALEPERADEHLRQANEYSERAVQLAIATGRVKPETRLEHAIRLLSAGRVDEALAELEWYATQRPDDPRGQAALSEARQRHEATGGH